jgi:hypothetical protein
MQIGRAHHTVLIVVAVVAWALAVRINVLPIAFNRSLTGDPASYVNVAHNILIGNGIVRDHVGTQGGVLQAYYPPLYPLLMAVAGTVVPPNPAIFLILNFAIDLLAAGAMLWLARLVKLPGTAGLAAAAVYLLWPTVILMSPVPYKEGLAALLTVLAVCFLIKRNAVGFGLSSALLALTQPALAFFPMFAALLLRWHGDWWKTMVLSAGVAILVMSPWWIRNYLIFDRFIPLTTGSGGNFWLGTTPLSDGIRWIGEAGKYVHGYEPDMSIRAYSDAFAWIATHPLEYARHTASKALLMLRPDQWEAKPLSWMPPIRRGGFWLSVFPAITSGLLFLSAMIGAFFLRQSPLTKALAAGLINLFAIQVWFQFAERHRYFMTPLLILLSVAAASLVIGETRQRSVKDVLKNISATVDAYRAALVRVVGT